MDKGNEHLSGATRGERAGINALGNPLDFIAEDHMREREVCALIDQLISASSVAPDIVRQVLTFLEDHLPLHLADEEIDLFPLMQKRCEPEDEIEAVIDKLHSDHDHALADAPDVVEILRNVGSSSVALAETDCNCMSAFAHEARRHLILENAIILPIARARLLPEDLAMMRQHMLERRGLATGPEERQC